jgi:hypothetical protein
MRKDTRLWSLYVSVSGLGQVPEDGVSVDTLGQRFDAGRYVCVSLYGRRVVHVFEASIPRVRQEGRYGHRQRLGHGRARAVRPLRYLDAVVSAVVDVALVDLRTGVRVDVVDAVELEEGLGVDGGHAARRETLLSLGRVFGYDELSKNTTVNTDKLTRQQIGTH